MGKFTGSRMNRQTQNKNLVEAKNRLEQSKTELEVAKDDLENKRYWADRAEKYLERMRDGYSEGSKLYYDSFKTRAMLVTGSILVILALSGSVVPTDPAYAPVLWVSCALLLFSMVAALKTMEGVTINVFTDLTNEVPPEVAKAGGTIDEAEGLKKQREKNNRKLARRTQMASGSFLLGLGAFVVYVALPPLAELIGLGWAILLSILVAAVLGILYHRF